MMSRNFSDAQNYYQRMKELQEKLKQSEDERMKMEKKFNKILQTCRADERIRKLSSAKDNYFQLLEEDRLRSDRNDSLMQILDRIENRACSINAKTERLRLLRKHYEAYMERTYPGWKANESKFYESYNEKLKAINSHFRTLSNDYTDIPTWKTSSEMDTSRDDFSSTTAYSAVNIPQYSYSNTSSFNLPDQNRVRSHIKNSDSQTDIYNNFSYNQVPSIYYTPATSTYNKDVSPLGKSMSFKTTNYTLNNLTNPIKSTYATNYSKPASIVSDFDSETFTLNNDISYSQTRQIGMDLDKDLNTKSDYYTNDLLDRTTNSTQLNSYSPRFSRYDSSRQSLKYSYNPISPVVKYTNNYSRPSSYGKSYTPKSLTRSASLDTFTTKYSPRYRYQNSTMPTPSSYTRGDLFRSNSLGRIPQESRLSFSSTKPANSYDYGGGSYKKYSPRSNFPERKSYSTLSPIYTSNRIPSDAGYFSHRSTSPGNSSTYSSYNAAASSYSRYNTPRLKQSNSNKNNYDPPYTSTTISRSVTSNLPYMSTLSRSQSFSEIDDLDYLSRKKNYDMSGWNQYPMGRERFCYDNRSSTNYGPTSPYTNQYRTGYSPEPSYNTRSYSFQADKSTSTDDGYDEDKTSYGKRVNRVHYADNIMSNDYNDYTVERPLDSNPRTYDRDLYSQKPIDEFERKAVAASEITAPSKISDNHDGKKLSTKEEPDRTPTNKAELKNGSSLDAFKSPTTLPYSQQALQTLEERTEEDITQSTSENPSLGSEQHWENEIGKLKDIMNYESQPPDTLAPGNETDQKRFTEPNSYYNRSRHSPTATDKPIDAQNGRLHPTKENSGFSELPDLKQEIEMLRKNKPTAEESDDFKQNSNDYPNPSVKLNEQHCEQQQYYSNSEYNPNTPRENIDDISKEPKVHLNYNLQQKENMNDHINRTLTQRISPSHVLEESQVLEKQDQPEKYDKKYNEVRGSNKELNKSPVFSPPRQISPVFQARDQNEIVQGSQNERQIAEENLPVQENTTRNLRDMGHEQSFPSNLQTTSDKSPSRSQFNIGHSNMNDNQVIDNTNSDIIQPSNGVKTGTALVNSQDQAGKVANIQHPQFLNKVDPTTKSPIKISENAPRVNNQNQESSQPIQPDLNTNITGVSSDSFPIESAQRTKQNADVKYDLTQPSLQTPQEDGNQQKTEDIQEENIKPQSPQNLQPQQQLYKNGVPQINPISSDEVKDHKQQPLTQTPQQLGDEVSLQQPVIQNQQHYEQPQYQNYEEREPYDQYSYNAAGGDDYQPQYDNTNAYQYNEEQTAQQYPDNQAHQQYQEPQYTEQEQYSQPQNDQYPQTQEGQYNPQQEGQYPQELEGQYPQQQDGQYPQQQEGQYPQQQVGQYPQQQEGQYLQQQDGQYPQQQDGQYPQQQGDQYPQQQGDQYPQPHEAQYSQQQMGNYPPQQDEQYPPQYLEEKMANDQMPMQRQYPEGQVPEQYTENQYVEEPQQYSGEQLPQQYMEGQNQQPYQDSQYDDGQVAQQYPNEQYNNYQQDNTAYPENYYEQQNYQGYNEQPPEHYQQNPDQYNATKPEEQFYSEGQVDDKGHQPTEQVLPSTGNYDQQQVEQPSVPIPEQQLADDGYTDASQEQQDTESIKLKEESQKEVLKAEPEKPPSPGSNAVESDKKGEVKSSPKQEGNISTAPEPAQAVQGDKPASGASKPTAGSKVAEGKTEVGASKQTPVTPSRGEKTSDSSGGTTSKGATRAGEKKSDAGGKASIAAKTADSKPGTKAKAGEKAGGIKGAATARTATKAQK